MPNTIVRSCWALALLAGLLVPGLSLAQTPGAPNPTALHDGVVIDAAAGVAYVMSPQGGVDALELTTGNVVWKSAAAAKPLLATESALVAQAPPGQSGEFAIVTLDSKGVAKGRVDIELPSGVRAQVVDGLGQSFRTEAFLAGNGDVVVTWQAKDGRSGGMLPPAVEAPQTESATAASRAAAAATAAATERRHGAARLDLAAGRAVKMSYDEAEALRPAAVSAAARVSAKSAVGGGQQLTSLDGRHVLHSERSPEGTLWVPYRWTVTDAAGATVGTIDAPVSMSPFVVSGAQLFYVAQPSVRKVGATFVEEPLRVRSLDLRSGVEVWAAPFVESTYRGPFPP